MLPSCRLLLLLGAGVFVTQASPVQAQSAMQMIEQLRPGGATRGIRMPDAAAPTPEAPAAAASTGQSGVAPRAATPRRAAPTAPAAAQTTAPTGTPALSITVQFATGSASLTPQAERALAPLGQALSSAELAPYRFRIEGHTDTVGTAEENTALSQRRADAVRDFLVSRFGIAASRLDAVGLGESQLLIKTGDNQPEQRNRRVQVLNIGS